MDGWATRLRALPLRAKVLVTVGGSALVLLGLSTYLSFRYWQSEALVIAEQQALLAAGAVRGSVETSLSAGRTAQARRSLRKMVEKGYISEARVLSTGGTVVLSSRPEEEGSRRGNIWLPERRLLPPEGVVHYIAAEQTVHAFLPLALPENGYLQATFPVGALRSALDRGLSVGLLLVVASLIAMGALLYTMLEREVVAPVRRVSRLLGHGGVGGGRHRTDEIRRLADSVERLIEKEQEVEQLAETQRRQIEAQAGLAQVGEMAAEMAHEFKRPLASIHTALEMMSQEYALDGRGGALLDQVQGQLEKLSETMRDLFALAKPVEFERDSVDLREIVDGALMQLSGHPAAVGVELRRQHGGPAFVYGDPRRLEQVALNLLLNAAESLGGSGQVTARVSGADGRVVLSVEDTGPGIPKEAIEKVLLPFYSTKPMGTGLGLSLVARIVAGHEGQLRIDSEPGHGTTVQVELPAATPRGPDSEEAAWLTHASS